MLMIYAGNGCNEWRNDVAKKLDFRSIEVGDPNR
jgi:hypothetical protein